MNYELIFSLQNSLIKKNTQKKNNQTTSLLAPSFTTKLAPKKTTSIFHVVSSKTLEPLSSARPKGIFLTAVKNKETPPTVGACTLFNGRDMETYF